MQAFVVMQRLSAEIPVAQNSSQQDNRNEGQPFDDLFARWTAEVEASRLLILLVYIHIILYAARGDQLRWASFYIFRQIDDAYLCAGFMDFTDLPIFLYIPRILGVSLRVPGGIHRITLFCFIAFQRISSSKPCYMVAILVMPASLLLDTETYDFTLYIVSP